MKNDYNFPIIKQIIPNTKNQSIVYYFKDDKNYDIWFSSIICWGLIKEIDSCGEYTYIKPIIQHDKYEYHFDIADCEEQIICIEDDDFIKTLNNPKEYYKDKVEFIENEKKRYDDLIKKKR